METNNMRYQLEHPSITEYDPNIQKIKLEDLKKIEDHSIEDINLYNIFEHQEKLTINNTITLILSKLRLSGKCSMIGLDLNKACELYLDKTLSVEDFHTLSQNKILYPISNMVNILKQNDCEIRTVKTDRMVYYIEFGRKTNV